MSDTPNSPPKKSSSQVSSAGSPPKRSGGSSVFKPIEDDIDGTKADFIYGGPFIKVEKPSPFLDTATPINLQLQGTFKKSYAYYSLKERLPVILTKIIDYLSREGSKVKSSCGASDDEVRVLMQTVTKLKNDLITNKKYDKFRVDTPEAKKWNEWIDSLESTHYFTNAWVWTECYVYRKIYEGCELGTNLIKFDPFEELKQQAFANSLEPMCVVAEKMPSMLRKSDKDKRKADFITLLKLCLWANRSDLSHPAGEQICLWANRCDISHSMGEPVTLKHPVRPPPPPRVEPPPGKKKGKKGPPAPPPPPPNLGYMDPFQFIIDCKDWMVIDDSAKVADQIQNKADKIRQNIQNEAEAPPPAPPTGDPPAEPPKIPCPAKMTVPQAVIFDIVCDNAGYELFADICLAHFLVAQKIVQKVRFHVKKYPWFVSDVTPKDFKYVVDSCANANFSKEAVKPVETKEGEEPPPPDPPKLINSDALRELGNTWKEYLENGTFIVLSDPFWTYPHTYKDMKKIDYNMYRKLQHAVGILFKGDLNYRKLLGERNTNPYAGFEASLQGFIPAPIVAVRVVKSELICGMGKGKFEVFNKLDEKWMIKGDYGQIQFCPKAEPLKVSTVPCLDYCEECHGVICPTHTDL